MPRKGMCAWHPGALIVCACACVCVCVHISVVLVNHN